MLLDIRSNWTIFICFSYGDGQDAGCWEEGDLSFLRGGQKVSREASLVYLDANQQWFLSFFLLDT